MPKPDLLPHYEQLCSDIIDTLLAGHQEWRPDLHYPESHSDMKGAVMALLRVFEVKRRPVPLDRSELRPPKEGEFPTRMPRVGWTEEDHERALRQPEDLDE